ncbi:poly-gamma-glutamate hydrolase family protein [Staphylococcus xylosus]|uniref:poly-gamma-glutamate hydrolase family protein n=1 Tax=Staphylococcus xylosus TaxID=1288 RepID=UPI001C3D1C7E|nr:poly-gamma-glutamate hydrolase family protein [Staphylococcus xylosus]MBV5139060.1 poly-gamma-glutamate hydrolase family protein [Staphylococcus xylosus]MBW3124758.1 poly-gamma-glutamate hydrolase family protein [Staphylococcus xylosus]
MNDKYNSMSELEAKTTENNDWEIVTRNLGSQVIIAAIHGGGIEPGTTEIADLTAKKGEYDYFSFKGTKSKGNEDLHVTSRNYDQSVLIEMIKNKTNAVAIHGCDGDGNIIYIGRKDQKLIHEMTKQFEQLNINVEQEPEHISGAHDDNIINCCKTGAGVQLELTPDLRKMCFNNQKYNKKSREDKHNWSQFMDEFTTAIVKSI